MPSVSTPYNLQVYRQRLEQLHPDDELKDKLVSLIKQTIEAHQLPSEDQLTDAHFREILERLHLDDNARFRGRLLSVGIPYVSRYSPWSNRRATGKVMALMGRLDIQTADLQPRRKAEAPPPRGEGERAADPLPPPVGAQTQPTKPPAGGPPQGASAPEPVASLVVAQTQPMKPPAGGPPQGAPPPEPVASLVVAKGASVAVKPSAAGALSRSEVKPDSNSYHRAISQIQNWSSYVAPSATAIRTACDTFVDALRYFAQKPYKASELAAKFEAFEHGMFQALITPGVSSDKPTYAAWARGMASAFLQYGNMAQQRGDIDEAINVYTNGVYAICDQAAVSHNDTALMPFVDKLRELLQGKAESALATGHVAEAAGYLAELGHLCLTVGNNEEGERLYSDAASHLEKAAQKNRAEGRTAIARKQEDLAAGVRKECAATLRSVRKQIPEEVRNARESIAFLKRAWEKGDARPSLAVMKYARVLAQHGFTEEAGDAYVLAAELDVHAHKISPNNRGALEQGIENYRHARALLASDDARRAGIPRIIEDLERRLRDLQFGLGPAGSTGRPEEEKSHADEKEDPAGEKEDHAEKKRDYAEEKDDCAVLQIQPGASLREITIAKRRLLLKYHPDKAPDRNNAEDMERREAMSKRIILAAERLGL